MLAGFIPANAEEAAPAPAAVPVVAAPAVADPAVKKAALEMIEQSKMSDLFKDAVMKSMQETLKEEKAAFDEETAYSTTPIDKCVKDYFDWNAKMAQDAGIKHFDSAKFNDAVATIYADIFTVEDIAQMKAFYATPAGHEYLANGGNMKGLDRAAITQIVEFETSPAGKKLKDKDTEISQRIEKADIMNEFFKNLRTDILVNRMEYLEKCPSIEKYSIM